jgi:hypothetical protein
MKMIFSNVSANTKDIQSNKTNMQINNATIINNTVTIQSMQLNMIGRLMYSRTCKSCQR